MRPKQTASSAAFAGSVILLLAAHGQPIISSFSGNGTLVCNNLEPDTLLSVEWAPTVNGPWTNSWAGLEAVVVGADGSIRVKVPMFYRVRGEPAVVPEGMVLIPAGSFEMGDAFGEGWSGELPVHTVYVSAFYMDKYEVTKALWDEVYSWAIEHGYSFDNPGSGKGPDHPVHDVNWYDVVKWCNARSENEGGVPAYYTTSAQTTVYRTGRVDVGNDWVNWDAGYRLPTEAEWEKAARGGLSGKRFPWGDTISRSQANYYSSAEYSYDVSPIRGNHPDYDNYTSPVGAFDANGYGLHDMAGNVWEWCWDKCWTDYSTSSGTDPRGPSEGPSRVDRGGAWGNKASSCRVALRDAYYHPSLGCPDIGFRSVLPPGQ